MQHCSTSVPVCVATVHNTIGESLSDPHIVVNVIWSSLLSSVVFLPALFTVCQFLAPRHN